MADGRMQDRDNGQDVSSPTIATESLFTLAAVFAAERRRVVTVSRELSSRRDDQRNLHGDFRSEFRRIIIYIMRIFIVK